MMRHVKQNMNKSMATYIMISDYGAQPLSGDASSSESDADH
jgi:hypothetical protein